MEVVVSLLDLVHAALQVSVELHPLRLQTTHHLVRPTLTCQDDCFLSNKRKKNTMKDGESINRLFDDERIVSWAIMIYKYNIYTHHKYKTTQLRHRSCSFQINTERITYLYWQCVRPLCGRPT